MPNDARLVDLQFYPVSEGQPVRVRAIVGAGMAGGTSISYKGQVQEVGTDGSATVGAPGGNLRHSVIHCITTVKDINPASDKTVVTYILSGGPDEAMFSYELDVNTSGGYARYLIDFALV
ncbi:MAG TPA: hypothetical protein VF665_06065 [Longimicrobium sp.]|jgi:hypothetical protein|uniref:hypothetical protein n=1 Tax=Longimicrobium sp. TaxID=2029185 RepID=UPI002EDBA7BD